MKSIKTFEKFEDDFDDDDHHFKLEELVDEFNSLRSSLNCFQNGAMGTEDYCLLLNCTNISVEEFEEIKEFLIKYNARIGLAPALDDNLCIIIESDDVD